MESNTAEVIFVYPDEAKKAKITAAVEGRVKGGLTGVLWGETGVWLGCCRGWLNCDTLETFVWGPRPSACWATAAAGLEGCRERFSPVATGLLVWFPNVCMENWGPAAAACCRAPDSMHAWNINCSPPVFRFPLPIGWSRHMRLLKLWYAWFLCLSTKHNLHTSAL